MEPITPTPQRTPVPVPPQRIAKTANPPKPTSAVPPSLNNNTPSTLNNTSKNKSTHNSWYKKVLILFKFTFVFHFLCLKIQFSHLFQTLALRTTTLSKWKKRKITRIAWLPLGSLHLSLHYLLAKLLLFHPILRGLLQSLKTELPPYRPKTAPQSLAASQSKLTSVTAK